MSPRLKENLFKVSCVLFLLGSKAQDVDAQNYEIMVSAGGFDRTETVVSFPFPAELGQGVYQMKAFSGDPVLVQVDKKQYRMVYPG